MSWTYGQKKWEIPFKSLNGTDCRVDIYKRGYSGSVTTLSIDNHSAPGVPAANPFYYEEDDDSNLLSVIRYKTGYINLVETIAGGLSGLMPATNTDHWVEFYYGTTLMFTGFMQAQSFENEWVAVPREISFPIISPLGLLDGYRFGVTNPPEWKSLEDLLCEVISSSSFDGAYDSIIFPDMGGFGQRGAILTYHSILSTVVCPFNSDYNHENDITKVFDPQSYRYFIEGLCNCWGCIAHDEPNRIVFQKVDWTGDYFRMIRSGTNYFISGSSEALSVAIAGNDNTESNVLPVNKITINTDGSIIDSVKCKFDHCKRIAKSSLIDGSGFVINTPITDELSSDNLLTDAYITADGKPSASGVILGAFGIGTLTEYVIIYGSSSGSLSGTLLTWKVYEAPFMRYGYKIKVSMKWGFSIEEMDNSEPVVVSWPHLIFDISCGSMKWDGTNKVWNTTGSHMDKTIVDGECEIVIPTSPGELAPLVITISGSNIGVGIVYCIENLSVEYGGDFVTNYLNDHGDVNKRVLIGSPSTEESEFDAAFLPDVSTDHRLERTTAGGSTPVPSYSYMLASQSRIQITCNTTLPTSPYCKPLIFDGGTWRLIAETFEPWNDKWVLTLQR